MRVLFKNGSQGRMSQGFRFTIHDPLRDSATIGFDAESRECRTERIDIALQEDRGVRILIDNNQLREVDHDDAFVPPEQIERREVPVDTAARDDCGERIDRLSECVLRFTGRQSEFRKTGRRLVPFADKLHDDCLPGVCGGAGDRHAPRVEQFKLVIFVLDPER